MKSLTQYILEKQEDKKDEKIVESFIKFVEIKSKSELLNLLKEHDSDEKKKTGFWLFDELINKDKEYSIVDEGTWKIKYTEVKYQSETVGLIGYSIDYNEEFYKPALHIFGLQTLHGHKGFLKYYFKYLETIAKNNTKRFITLRLYDKEKIKLYKKYKFKTSSKENEIMFKEM